MFSKIIYAHIIVILIYQLGFLFYLGRKNRKSDYYYLTICYIVYALAFYLIGGYVGTLFYMMCASNILMQLFKANKNILCRLVFTSGFIYLYLYSKDYSFYNNIPYLVALSYMWIKPFMKGFKKELIEHLENILIIVYAYQFKLYALAFIELYRLCFKIISKGFSRYIKFINKRI